MCISRSVLRCLREDLLARLTKRISEGKLANSRKVRLDPAPDDILKMVLMRCAASRKKAKTRAELYRDAVRSHQYLSGLSRFIQEPWYLKEHVFRLWHSNMETDLGWLTSQLSKTIHDAWDLVSYLTVDESVFAWDGDPALCPVHQYIPRKPHPNGLLSYGLCCWTAVNGRKLPILISSIPYCDVANKPTAQGSMKELLRRFKEVFFLSKHCPYLLYRSAQPSPPHTS